MRVAISRDTQTSEDSLSRFWGKFIAFSELVREKFSDLLSPVHPHDDGDDDGEHEVPGGPRRGASGQAKIEIGTLARVPVVSILVLPTTCHGSLRPLSSSPSSVLLLLCFSSPRHLHRGLLLLLHDAA